MDDTATLIWGVLFGAIGLGFLTYGRRQRAIVPLIAGVALLLIPYLNYDTEPTGPWFLSQVGRRTAAAAAVTALVITPALIVVDELWLHPSAGLPSVIGRGLAPLTSLAAAVLGFRFVLVRKFGASKAEVVQALFILFFVDLVFIIFFSSIDVLQMNVLERFFGTGTP